LGRFKLNNDLFVVALVIEFSPDDIIYLCNSENDIEYDNNIYVGSKVLNISSLGGGSLSKPANVNLEILGIAKEDRSIFRTKLSPIPLVTLQAIASNDNGKTWTAIGNTLKGPISSPKLQGGKFSCIIAPRSVQANNNRIRYWSHEDRVRRFGQIDQGMAQMVLFEKREVFGTWPQI